MLRPRASWVRCPNVPPNWNLYPVWPRKSVMYSQRGMKKTVNSQLHRLSKLPFKTCSQLPAELPLSFLSKAKPQDWTDISLSLSIPVPQEPHLHTHHSPRSLSGALLTCHVASLVKQKTQILKVGAGKPWEEVWGPSVPCPVSTSAQIPAAPGW